MIPGWCPYRTLHHMPSICLYFHASFCLQHWLAAGKFNVEAALSARNWFPLTRDVLPQNVCKSNLEHGLPTSILIKYPGQCMAQFYPGINGTVKVITFLVQIIEHCLCSSLDFGGFVFFCDNQPLVTTSNVLGLPQGHTHTPLWKSYYTTLSSSA